MQVRRAVGGTGLPAELFQVVAVDGELVEVELEIDSKNDYEYLLFEDMKAAGFEPVEVRSGYNGNDLNAYMELRDERVCFFARTLSRGKHSVATTGLTPWPASRRRWTTGSAGCWT